MGLLKLAGNALNALTKKKDPPDESTLHLLGIEAQINKTKARPTIAIRVVSVYLILVLVKAIQELCGIHEAYLISIPVALPGFVKIIVLGYFTSRGLEKVTGMITTKIKEKKTEKAQRKEERKRRKEDK